MKPNTTSTSKSRASKSVRSARQTDPTAGNIHVVYPKPGHKTYEASVFLMGQVKPAGNQTHLHIQSQTIPLSKQGFFSYRVPLEFGQNKFELELTINHHPVAHHTMQIHRHTPLPVATANTPIIHHETIEPRHDVSLFPGDFLTVEFSATPGASISVSIPGILNTPVQLQAAYPNAKISADGYIDNREIIFAEPHQTSKLIPKAGWVSGNIRLPLDTPKIEHAPIHLHVTANGKTQIFKAPGKLSIWHQPKTAIVKNKATVIRTTPENGARLTPLQPGAELLVDGQYGNWARIRLSPQTIAWVNEKDITWTNASPPPYALVPCIQTASTHSASSDSRSAELQLITPYPLPIHVSAHPNRLTAWVYGATSQCDFIQYAPETQSVFSVVEWQQPAEGIMQIDAQLKPNTGALCGFSIYYPKNGISLQLHTLPSNPRQVRILIDPGHGGAEFGSTGLSGLPEKDLNLTVSRILKQALQNLGFQVKMTRETDQELSLQDRSQQVEDWAAHLTLSIHHNALPDGRDPMRYQGACTFYYHPFAKPLADKIQRSLTQNAGAPDFGVFYDSLYMTRIHQSIAVLIELGFFTHPKEYERLLDPIFQKQAVQAIATAVYQFVAG